MLELQILTSLKHSSEDMGFAQEKNSSPKIFDETCKNEKNARMLVEEVFSFPEQYFKKDWPGRVEEPSQSVGEEEGMAIDAAKTSNDNNIIAATTTAAASLTAKRKSKNETDPTLLLEFLSNID
jgi:hypothetical protein